MRRTMGPSIDGGSRIRPPMPHQSVRKYRSPRDKVTRPPPQIPCPRLPSDAQQAPLDYRRPLKIGNIVQTSVNALMSYALHRVREKHDGLHRHATFGTLAAVRKKRATGNARYAASVPPGENR
jgi:hypothetical protein